MLWTGKSASLRTPMMHTCSSRPAAEDETYGFPIANTLVACASILFLMLRALQAHCAAKVCRQATGC